MTEWRPYEWPSDDRDPWKEWVEETLRDLWAQMGQVQPQEVMDSGPGVDDDAALDGGDLGVGLDGHTLPLDGGDLDRGLGGGGHTAAPGELPVDPNGVWKVITARIADQVDIQKLATTSTVQPGEMHRNVWSPTELGTPAVGEHGTAWRLPDGTVAFLHCGATNIGVPSNPVVLEHTAGSETAETDSWDITAIPEGYDGVSVSDLTAVVYNDAGDEILYEFYRTKTYNAAGVLTSITTETRQLIDTPEAC